MTGRARRSANRALEAPHRRAGAPPRVVERGGVIAYRLGGAVLARLPERLSVAVVATAAQAGYVFLPVRRHWSNANFGHVLGLPPEKRAVRMLALRAYRNYARYLVELIRLPSRPLEEVIEQVDSAAIDALGERWRASGRPLIVTAGHVGSNEAIGAALADHGYPVSVVADDSAFPELFELLRSQRAAWGVTLVPWRNLRGLYDVLRRREILGLLVDWGYRGDGVPVRLFGAWTTLPAGPATLAARTNASIAHIAIRHTGGGRYIADVSEDIRPTSTEPAEILGATQAIADALEATIRAAPEQWYSFKPMWPLDPAEAEDLERRAALMAANQRDPGPRPLPQDSVIAPDRSAVPPNTARAEG